MPWSGKMMSRVSMMVFFGATFFQPQPFRDGWKIRIFSITVRFGQRLNS